ncbi:MAG: Gfo/Idh/MocA family oxidoreductase [Gemmataceae bacterium]|nr:Gfo/Idh/MocA family oxidoreductase [Gemmataceae bacterium]
MTRLGWCVVGCGWVARDYVVPAIRASRNGRLVAACDPSDNALSRIAGGDCVRTTELAEALAAPGVGAVYVATPNHAHRAVVESAAAAGKAVLCEKPMATTAAAAAAMVAACERAGVVYATAFDQRFHAAHHALARLVRRGRLGTVTQARVHYACWLPPGWAADNWRADPARAGGGALIDLAPHGVDLLELLLGDEWAELHALTQRRVHPYPVDDGAVLMGRFRSGTLATLHVGYNCPEAFPRRTLELIGTEVRALALDTMGQTPGGSLTLTDAATGRDAAVSLDDDRSPFLVQVEAFAGAVLTGEPFPFPAADDLRRCALLEAACR